jgi:hypothetical protein
MVSVVVPSPLLPNSTDIGLAVWAWAICEQSTNNTQAVAVNSHPIEWAAFEMIMHLMKTNKQSLSLRIIVGVNDMRFPFSKDISIYVSVIHLRFNFFQSRCACDM